MAVMTTNEENRYQRMQYDAEFRSECERRAEEIARERRRAAEAAGYVYRSNR